MRDSMLKNQVNYAFGADANAGHNSYRQIRVTSDLSATRKVGRNHSTMHLYKLLVLAL